MRQSSIFPSSILREHERGQNWTPPTALSVFIPLGYTLHFSRGTRSSSNLICNLSSPWPRCFCVILFEIKRVRERESERSRVRVRKRQQLDSIEIQNGDDLIVSSRSKNTRNRRIKEQKKRTVKWARCRTGARTGPRPHRSVSVVVFRRDYG